MAVVVLGSKQGGISEQNSTGQKQEAHLWVSLVCAKLGACFAAEQQCGPESRQKCE